VRPIDLIVAVVTVMAAASAMATVVSLGGHPAVALGSGLIVGLVFLWSLHQPPAAPPDPPEDK